ncbi:MAG: hypothetical protein LBV69_05200, partial [Bacteroidales bacterium]|nr:hypothetical protein [Bacteroidales bacterium]
SSSFAAGELKNAYNDFLGKILKTSVAQNMFEIANLIVENELISTIFCIQNYLVYNNGNTKLNSISKLGDHIIMYPYYWQSN